MSDRPSQQRPKCRWVWLSWLLLLSMGGLVSGGIWLSIQLMVNPVSVSWLLPQWNRAGGQGPQTLDQIRADARRAGLEAGMPLYLSAYSTLNSRAVGFRDVILPLLASESHCSTAACRQIVELRVYRPIAANSPKLDLVDRISVDGMEEVLAIAPLVQSGAIAQGSNRVLPMTDITFLTGNPPMPGVWLTLQGTWQRGSSTALYGQLIRYDPNRPQLQPLLNWTSPAGQLPQWQQVTGSQAAELVVDQTVGLEPQFNVYSVRSNHAFLVPVQLVAIELTPPALHNRAYEQALNLARSGLWSSALQLLLPLKARDDWTPAAQSQMDVIALHANLTKAQADRNWASPGQKIAAQIIDGRWAGALKVLQAAHQDGYDIPGLINANARLFWRRIQTALQVNPNQPAVQRWGVLVQAVLHDRSTALSWYQRQIRPPAKADRQIAQIFALLDPLPDAAVNTSNPPSGSGSSSSGSSASAEPILQLLGTAAPAGTIQTAAWHYSGDRLALSPQQSWYQVRVESVQTSQGWHNATFADLAPSQRSDPWAAIGLSPDTPLQLSSAHSQQAVTAQLKAWRVQDGQLLLLVAADADSRPAPAIASLGGPRWLQPDRTLTLAELQQQQPDWATGVTTTLQQTLQKTGYTVAVSDADPAAGSPEHWTIDLIDLTGDGQPEARLLVATQPNRPAHTLIFSHQGTLLYSDLDAPDRSIAGTLDLGDGGSPVLAVADDRGYHFWRWSAAAQKFVEMRF